MSAARSGEEGNKQEEGESQQRTDGRLLLAFICWVSQASLVVLAVLPGKLVLARGKERGAQVACMCMAGGGAGTYGPGKRLAHTHTHTPAGW